MDVNSAIKNEGAIIQHVFMLMLGNRSFDHLFALSGIPEIVAATSENSNTCNGITYPFGDEAPGQMPTDPKHEFPDVVEQLCGASTQLQRGEPFLLIDNPGFASNYTTTRTEGPLPQGSEIGYIMRGVDTRNQWRSSWLSIFRSK